ncbi:hypothetical protein DZS_15980 [Dickeya ananatis]
MSNGWNIALLGATGAVGTALLELLQEREFPVGELYALASENSVGESLRFNGRSLRVEDAADFDWSQVQLAFFRRRYRCQCSLCASRRRCRVSGD